MSDAGNGQREGFGVAFLVLKKHASSGLGVLFTGSCLFFVPSNEN